VIKHTIRYQEILTESVGRL